METVRSESDLEDGEIRDDVLEDISDCSLSDIIHEDLNDGNNLDTLRNEALKSLQNEEPANEEEKCRLEALKSLLENTGFLNENEESLQGIEDLTEEEKFRVEAVKSLLRNIDFLTTKNTPQTLPNHTKKRRRQRQRKLKKSESSPQKRSKVKEEPVEDALPNVPYLEETTSLLSELKEDVKKIHESIEVKKAEKSVDTNQVNKENINKNDSIDESPVMVNSARSWYPKTEFTLLDIPFARNVGVKRNKRDVGHKVKPQSNSSSNQNPEKIPVANHSQKTEPISERLEPSDISIKPVELPKQEPLSDTVDTEVPIIEAVISNKPLESNPIKIETSDVPNKPTRAVCDFQQTKKVKKISHTIIRPNMLIRSPKSRPSVIKLSTPCSFRKFNPTQSVPNGKTFSLVRKSNRYKLNNVPNSKYALKKTALKIDKTKLKLNNAVQSRYSINRTNQYKKVNLKEFIIPLDDDDREDSSNSSKEDFPPHSEPVIFETPKIFSSVINNAEEDVPKIKEEPRDVPEELPHDDFTLTESPSTTTVDPVPLAKEEPVPEAANNIFNISNVTIGEVISLKCDTSSGPISQDPPNPSNDKPESKSELDVLLEAEENLIEIRSKLLSSLGELDTSIKTNTQEKDKLLNMVKKLNLLKAAVTKFEDKVKTQKMKLAMSNSVTQTLYEGVMLRSKTCSKMKDLCSMAGKKIIGPRYRPPEDFETQLEEKQKTLDFSKYVPKAADKK